MPGNRDDPELHFDAENIDSSRQKLAQRYVQLIQTVLGDGDFDTGRTLLGRSLHAIQVCHLVSFALQNTKRLLYFKKFYSNTNWVENGNSVSCANLGLPGESCGSEVNRNLTTCDNSCESGALEDCKENIVVNDALLSGYLPYHEKPDVSVEKCSYGSKGDNGTSILGHGGINKATSTFCFSPHSHLHDQAAEMAIDVSTCRTVSKYESC